MTNADEEAYILLRTAGCIGENTVQLPETAGDYIISLGMRIQSERHEDRMSLLKSKIDKLKLSI